VLNLEASIKVPKEPKLSSIQLDCLTSREVNLFHSYHLAARVSVLKFSLANGGHQLNVPRDYERSRERKISSNDDWDDSPSVLCPHPDRDAVRFVRSCVIEVDFHARIIAAIPASRKYLLSVAARDPPRRKSVKSAGRGRGERGREREQREEEIER